MDDEELDEVVEMEVVLVGYWGRPGSAAAEPARARRKRDESWWYMVLGSLVVRVLGSPGEMKRKGERGMKTY